MSGGRIDLDALRAKAERAYGRRQRPASPTEVLALVEAVEAARACRDYAVQQHDSGFRVTFDDWTRLKAALAVFDAEEQP